MTTDIVLAYFHFISILSTVAFLLAERVWCREGVAGGELRTLARLDTAYFISAILALVTGVARAFFGAKGSAFYLDNPVFYAKIGLFAAVALVSIAPTVKFIRWSKRSKVEPVFAPPSSDIAHVRRWVNIELLLIAIIPLLAVLMARGIGH